MQRGHVAGLLTKLMQLLLVCYDMKHLACTKRAAAAVLSSTTGDAPSGRRNKISDTWQAIQVAISNLLCFRQPYSWYLVGQTHTHQQVHGLVPNWIRYQHGVSAFFCYQINQIKDMGTVCFCPSIDRPTSGSLFISSRSATGIIVLQGPWYNLYE